MVERKYMTHKILEQQDIDTIWSGMWRTEGASVKQVFANRLFIEGYKVFKQLIPHNAKTILEVGTGSGRYAVALARDFPQVNVAATDIVLEALVRARKLAEASQVNNIYFEIENVERLSYRDNSYDVVFSDAVIQHVPDDKKATAEMARVLNPGGVLILAVVNKQSLHFLVRFIQRIFNRRNEYGSERFYTHTQLCRLAKDTGLEVITQAGFYPSYGIYRLRRYWSPFALLGRLLNRLTRALDSVTGDRISRWFGFEIIIVARKPTAK
jgi:ubiquinone/menaquinone biosynthesis C-methylase UbiE